MDTANIIGTIAATLTTASFAPQALKVLRTKHTKDLSLNTYLLITVGTALWLVYGILLNAAPIIISNIISCLFAATILIAKIKYG